MIGSPLTASASFPDPVPAPAPARAVDLDYQTQGVKSGPNGLAIASLVCGCVSLLSAILAILAIIFGVIALNQIKASNGRQTGRGMAIAGIAIGMSYIFIMIGVIAVVILTSR